MDTIHDLGGREGFGPIRGQQDEDSKLFHQPWQARTWAICMLMMTRFQEDQTGWTLDWHRHVLERIAPADYLSMNYFDKWAQALMATLVDDGAAEIQEFVEGRSQKKPPQPILKPLAASAKSGVAKYVVGDRVVTKREIASIHTRLPSYARGRKGVIHCHVGPRILADSSAVGDLREEHLYTVRFESDDLWPESLGKGSRVFLDLWESYLAPT